MKIRIILFSLLLTFFFFGRTEFSYAATILTAKYVTYLGGNGADSAQMVFIDGNGFIYLAGGTSSTNLFPPQAGKYGQTYHGGELDGVVLKFSPDGQTLIWGMYLGGSDKDWNHGVYVDGAGDVYTAGFTRSSDFPTVSAYKNYNGAGEDYFLTKINRDGTRLVYSTFFGSNSVKDGGRTVLTANTAGELFFGLTARANNYPITSDAVQKTFGGGASDAFLGKLSANGNTLLYGSYLGGSADEEGWSGINIGMDGSVYFSGVTNSVNFPTTNGVLQPIYGGNATGNLWEGDGFITRFSANLSSLIFSTYIGGASGDGISENTGMVIDGSGKIYVQGHTSSVNFPTTPGALKRSLSGSYDQFISVISPDGKTLLSSTFLGGNGNEFSSGIAFDSVGNIYVGAESSSTDFPASLGSFKNSNAGGFDATLSVLSPDLTQLVYSTFLGGGAEDRTRGIFFNKTSNQVVVFGDTLSGNFVTTANAQAKTLSGAKDYFLSIFDISNIVSVMGDLNNDGRVNIYDYNILLVNFGRTGNFGFIPSDINASGKVDIFDYNILLANFGR